MIVDDEELARLALRRGLAAHVGVEIVAECANGFEAVKAVAAHQPDLILLDIQMPKLDGFEVLELIGDTVPVIFITAYDEYALRAFEVHALDYLLKPFDAKRLTEALQQARLRVHRHEGGPSREVVAHLRPPRPLTRILIRDRADVQIVPIETVDFVEAQDDYAAIHASGHAHLKEQTLSDLEARLDAAYFVRIHRRYLLQLDRLARIETTATGSRIAVLKDRTRLPISRSGYRRLSERLDE